MKPSLIDIAALFSIGMLASLPNWWAKFACMAVAGAWAIWNYCEGFRHGKAKP